MKIHFPKEEMKEGFYSTPLKLYGIQTWRDFPVGDVVFYYNKYHLKKHDGDAPWKECKVVKSTNISRAFYKGKIIAENSGNLIVAEVE